MLLIRILELFEYIAQIHEYRGRYSADNVQKELLSELLEIARIQSTEASNRIEGIITTDDRLKKIVREKTLPKTRSEKEIAGYRDVLATIHENYEYIPVSSNMILQLHRDLYKFSGNGYGGNFKSVDNVIAEELPDGTKRVRFQPVPAWETAETVNDLCNAFKDAVNKQFMDILLLLPMFILDFLCIHPFNDGNGRMSRLLTLLILYKSEYYVGQYISIERLISDTKENYYEAFSLDDKRTETKENDIPDIIERFRNLDKETDRKRTEQSFFVPKEEIAENGYDLSINKYKEIEYVPVEYPSTQEIMIELHEIEMKIGEDMQALEELLGLK